MVEDVGQEIQQLLSLHKVKMNEENRLVNDESDVQLMQLDNEQSKSIDS